MQVGQLNIDMTAGGCILSYDLLWPQQNHIHICCAVPLSQLDIYYWPKGQQNFVDSQIKPQLKD